MDIQRINVRIALKAPANQDMGPILAIFAAWRHDEGAPEEWLDMADYAHVPDGPLAMIVGKQGNLVYDLERGEPTLLYRNKAALEGSIEQRVIESIRRAVGLAERLVKEPTFPSSTSVQPHNIHVAISDRVSAPNTEATAKALRGPIEAALAQVHGASAKRSWESDAARFFAVNSRAEGTLSLDTLAAKLQSPPVEATGGPKKMGLRRVSPQDAAELLKGGYVYVDVRTVGEFEAGHPVGAFNVPVMTFSPATGMAPNSAFVDVMSATFSKDDQIVLGCKSGGRSWHAAQMLEKAGFTDLVDNFAGYTGGQDPTGAAAPGWSAVGLPTDTEVAEGHDYQSLKAKA